MPKPYPKLLAFSAPVQNKKPALKKPCQALFHAAPVLHLENFRRQGYLPLHNPAGSPTGFGFGKQNPGLASQLVAIGLMICLHLGGWLSMPAPERQEKRLTREPIRVQWLKPQFSPSETVKPRPTVPVKKTARQPQKTTKPQRRTIQKIKRTIAVTGHTAVPLTPKTKPSAKPMTNTAINPATSAATVNLPTKPSPPAKTQPPATLPHLHAGYLHNPAPAYPSISRRLGEQGRVLIRALINPNGNVKHASLRRSSGFGRLDQAALESVKQWRFVPAQRGGQAVEAWVVVPVTFALEG